MGFPQARVGDLHPCILLAPPPAPPSPVPAPMPVMPPGLPTVLVGGMPAARMLDMVTPSFPHPILKGSATVLIGSMPAARVLDNCACGSPIVKGEFTVLVGG